MKFFKLYYAPDGDGGQGGGGQQPPATTPAAGNDAPPASWDAIFEHPRFKQLNDAKKAAEATLKQLQDAAAKQAAEAEAATKKQLEEQQQFQQLYQQETAKATTLAEQAAGMQAQVVAYETAVSGYLAKEKDGLPAHILSLLEKLPPLEQMAYIAENRNALGQPAGAPPATPNGDGGNKKADYVGEFLSRRRGDKK